MTVFFFFVFFVREFSDMQAIGEMCMKCLVALVHFQCESNCCANLEIRVKSKISME